MAIVGTHIKSLSSAAQRIKQDTEGIGKVASMELEAYEAAIAIKSSNATASKSDAALKAAYRGAAADGRISPKEIILLDKFSAKSEGEFSAAYQGAAADEGINLDEIRLLNEMLGVKDSFNPAKK